MQQGRPGISEPIVDLKPTRRQRVAAKADKALSFVLGQTIGRVARLAGKNMLGEIPEEALSGSYDETVSGAVEVIQEDVDELQAEISNQLAKENKKNKFGDKSKSWLYLIGIPSSTSFLWNEIVCFFLDHNSRLNGFHLSAFRPPPATAATTTTISSGGTHRNIIWSWTQGSTGTSEDW